MNIKGDSRNRCWPTSSKLSLAQRTLGIKIAVAISLVVSLSLAGLSQSFQNLDFEQAMLVPISGGYQGEVQIGPALPGWSVFTQVPYVLYDNMFLDSAGVSILDNHWSTFQGNFTVVLEGGFTLSWPLQRIPVAIAQTGTIPPSAKTLLFDAWVMSGGQSNFVVSLGPYYALASYTNYTSYAVDVSGFSGQTVGLQFTVFPMPPPGLAINIVYLDNIRFSSSPLAAPPLILTPPRSQTVNVGSNVEFTVYATGFPAPTYQWFVNGTNAIAGAISPVLELGNVLFSQSGAYSVVISNAYGSVTSPPAILTVRDPFIISQPLPQSANLGQTVFFSVGAGGTQPLVFQWLKDGVELSDGGRVSGAHTGGLTLSDVSGADGGNYSVTIANANSNVTSMPARLSVTDPIIASQPASQSVYPGGTARFAVVAEGTPPFTYQWFNTGVPLNDGPGISGARTDTLTLANVVSGETDAYWVVIANSYGRMTSAVVFVNLNPPRYSVLHSFSRPGGNPYSGNPNAALVLAGTTLYGTSEASVFKMNTDGTGFTTLTHQIQGGNGGLVLSDGTLYGTTYSGYNEASPDFGRVFKLNTDGSGFAVIKSFSGRADGGLLWAAPILYGSALYGATYTDGGSANGGTLFKVNTDGSDFTVLTDFSYSGNGPQGGMAISGNTLYGTLTYDIVTGIAGKVFKVNTDGSNFQIISQFNGDNGRYPLSRLLLSGGWLYGTTYYGGTASIGIGAGTVFKVGTAGGLDVLKEFSGGSDGANPAGDLVLAGGTLYGTTSRGGFSNYGTIFQIGVDGRNYTVLKRFRGSDGASPQAGLVLSGKTLYGTTQRGGSSDCGVVFALSLPVPWVLPPPTITCAPPVVLECSNGQAAGHLNLGLIDSSGNPVVVVWTIDGTPFQTNTISSGGAPNSTNVTLTAEFAFGEHLVTASASNGATNPATCSTSVQVRDTTLPQILSLSATPNLLWPPNNRLVPVTINLQATDNCAPTTSKIVGVTCNEAGGSSMGGPDWIITGDLSLELRAARLGKGQGRVYTIKVECADLAGNSSSGFITVVVPHDQRKAARQWVGSGL